MFVKGSLIPRNDKKRIIQFLKDHTIIIGTDSSDINFLFNKGTDSSIVYLMNWEG